MSTEIFTEAWAKACQNQLNRSETYRLSAQEWKWPLVLVRENGADGKAQRIFLDLWEGTCREARFATENDLQKADFVISASPKNWAQVLGGEVDPMMALMRGKLKLAKGKLFTLARFSGAAKALVAVAGEVSSPLPEPEVAEKINHSPDKTIPKTSVKADFVTTGPQGLRQEILPMKLYHKAKRLGIWNPQDIDFSTDKQDWQKLNDLEKEVLLHLTALFQAGEESVTRDLLPLIMVIANEGRLEEEMYLTTFLWEEAKHTEFFRRFLDEVAREHSDLSRFHTANYRKIFYKALPNAMNALKDDPSPAAQIRASVTYNMIVEGTLAETGYHAYYAMLERQQLLPGLQEGIGYLKRDESRHIAYGIHLLSRLIHENPEQWTMLEKQMTGLLDTALAIITELFETYPEMPFGLQPDDFLAFAMTQFESRMTHLEKACGSI